MAESNGLDNTDMGFVAFVVLVDINCTDCEFSETVVAFNDDSSCALTFDGFS